MSFREKSAWIMLGTTMLIYGFYFARVAPLLRGAADGSAYLGPFCAAVASLIILQVALHIVTAALAPGDAAAPPDERETQIDLRASRAGFYAAQAGAFLTMASVVLRPDPWLMANLLLLSMVAAEIIRAGAALIDFRRAAA